MRMGVDEAWDDSLVRPIDHLRTLWGGEVRGNASYAVALDEDVSDGVLVEDILDQYGHAGGFISWGRSCRTRRRTRCPCRRYLGAYSHWANG